WRAPAPPAEVVTRLEHVVLPVLEQGASIGRFDCLVPKVSADLLGAHAALAGALGEVMGLAYTKARVVRKVASLSRGALKGNARLRAALRAAGADGEIIARSEAMKDVLRLAELVAPHPTSVLLKGESGTVKEVVARFIHARSNRSAGPFIAVNCAAIPDALVESELFGHEEGAFTGAVRQYVGRFERASGGTLLLDEVAELPAPTQAKLLRVLQEGSVERVGGRDAIDVDVRVIAATHQPLEERIESGSFRADLFYRLASFPISIPPLRERPEDIVALADRQLEVLAARLGEPVASFDAQQMRALLRAPWPGNVRQLMNEVERAVILGEGGRPRLALDSLAASQRVAAPSEPRGAKMEVAPARSLDEFITLAIADALRASRGKVYGPGGAAERLDVKPSTLQAKMKKLGLRRADFTG
ncbi:MAG: sigma-54 dependent transcriptional regulator, partial [Planctomycetota bacterium]